MAVQIEKSTIQFLKDIAKNNDRDWFQDNKKKYEEAHQNFTEFIDELILSISSFDPSIGHHRAKDCVFRIYRDVRFSKNKDPYKTNFGAHITSAAKRSDIHSRAGYYIHLEPGKSMLAGGAYMPAKDWIKNIRSEIDHNAQELKAIVNNADFKKYFGELSGEKLKTAPRDYPKDHPEIELLRHKSFLAVHNMEDKKLDSPEFLGHCAQVYRALKPLDDFLNKCTE